jgi:alpha-methylacyl-CoA racemase
MMTTQPLFGLRILDLSRLLPGPYLTQLLADLGAEVIKIETPGVGDYARFAPPEMGLGGLFEAVNQDKKSVALNYRNPRGREVFMKLAASADVLLEGFKPGSVKKWRIDYESVREVKPDIVYCSLSGYGQAGPYRDRPGHDLNYLAISGALQLNARPGDTPIPYSLTAADLSGSMLAAIAILGALVGRSRNGQGMYLDMALFDGAMSWMGPLAGAAFFHGLELGAGSHPFMGGQPCYNVYKTSDGNYLSLAAIEPTFWSNFCMVTNRPDLIGHQFDSKISGELETMFGQRTRAQWLQAFDGTDACIEPVNSFEEMLVHPQVQARGFIREENGRAAGLNSPFIFARRERKGPPKLGEHTRTILSEIGIEAAEIEELVKGKVLAES